MTFDFSMNALLLALVIFALRVFNNAIGTVRVVMITRDMRFWSATLAFIEALTFAVVISSVVKDLSNFMNLMAYCGGFAVGGYVGMAIEARFITSYAVATIIAPGTNRDIANGLREHGFGVTETLGEGKDGTVNMLRSVILRREVSDFMGTVHRINPNAFVSVEEARAIQRGWLRDARNNNDQRT
jgi:uncharacterized protein YebE (UPF0316 family)